jgi:hypothetical protein
MPEVERAAADSRSSSLDANGDIAKVHDRCRRNRSGPTFLGTFKAPRALRPAAGETANPEVSHEHCPSGSSKKV